MKRARRAHWKGERRQLGPRFPAELFDILSEDSTRLDVTRADWIVHLVAQHYDRADLDPLADRLAHEQEPMLMTG